MKVTFFGGAIFTKTGGEEVELSRVLNDIKTGKYEDEICQLREIRSPGTKEAINDYKREKRKLPHYCFSCLTSVRKEKEIRERTGLIVADIDNLSTTAAAALQDEMRKDPYVLAAFISPSAEGIKALFKYDLANDHISAFNAVDAHIRRVYGYDVDPSGKDVVRACFTSYDEDIHINLNAKEITVLQAEKDLPKKQSDYREHEEETRFKVEADQDRFKDILERHGWTYEKTVSGCYHFLRPSEGDIPSPGSAKILPPNGSTPFYVLHVHTGTRTNLDPGGTYNAFDLFKHLDHKGDHRQALEAVRRMYSGNESTEATTACIEADTPEGIIEALVSRYKRKVGESDPADEPAIFQELLKDVIINTPEDPTNNRIYINYLLTLDAVAGRNIQEADIRETIRREKEKQSEIRRREIISQAMRKAEKETDPTRREDILSEALKESRKKQTGDILKIESLEDIVKKMSHAGDTIKTGIDPVDKMVTVFPGTTIYIGGRTSHGKTAFMLNVLINMVELYPEKTFVLYHYEEPNTNILPKLTNLLHAGEMLPPEVERDSYYRFFFNYFRDQRNDIPTVNEKRDLLAQYMKEGRLILIDQRLSAEKLHATLLSLSERHDIGAAFIDFIQKVPTDKSVSGIRERIVAATDHFSEAAKELNIPLFIGAQMNRDAVKSSTGQQSKNQRPTLENLKESGSIEEDANTVIAVYNQYREDMDRIKDKDINRDGQYIPREEKEERYVNLQIIVLKQRNGKVNIFETVPFDTYTLRIGELDEIAAFETQTEEGIWQ